MKISAIELVESKDGLAPFCIHSLGDIVIVSGSNGSGKTRLLKLLEHYVFSVRHGNDEDYFKLRIRDDASGERAFGTDNASDLEVVNYSHFDAQLQLPKGFTPYVISQAQELLQTCNYEETALNSLLLLEDMAHGYSEKFQNENVFEDFANKIAEDFHIDVKRDDENNLRFFDNLDPEKAALSPGQQYLLRIAVACYCNSENEKLIFLLDEPELHLHPQAQIELIKVLRKKFLTAQFWISTHSLSLISYLTVAEKTTTVLYLQNGKINILRSDSSPLLEGLLGTEENRFAIQQLMVTPDEYACNKFAAECTRPPETLGASGNDPQTELLQSIFNSGDVIVDFGAGKGRFLEELAMSPTNRMISEIEYYAYDPDKKDASQCMEVMRCYGIPKEHYYNESSLLIDTIGGKADYVLLVNVLHEIEPTEWIGLFNTIYTLLKDSGKLIIVEREELTIGEAPYNNGFLMITREGAHALFGAEHCFYEQHPNPKKSYIVKHTVDKEGMPVTMESIQQCIECIKNGAFHKIADIKKESEVFSDLSKYRKGIKLAFYLHQYANASLLLENMKK